MKKAPTLIIACFGLLIHAHTATALDFGVAYSVVAPPEFPAQRQLGLYLDMPLGPLSIAPGLSFLSMPRWSFLSENGSSWKEYAFALNPSVSLSFKALSIDAFDARLFGLLGGEYPISSGDSFSHLLRPLFADMGLGLGLRLNEAIKLGIDFSATVLSYDRDSGFGVPADRPYLRVSGKIGFSEASGKP